MTTKAVLLEPLDVLFFRDGRPFAASGRAASGLPTPQTLAGALRTALLEKYGCKFNEMRQASNFAAAVARACPQAPWIAQVAFRGPWFCRSAGAEVLVPAPAVLHRRKKQKGEELFSLRPLETDLPGWQTSQDDGLRPLWIKQREATEPSEGFLTPTGLRAFLNNQLVGSEQLVQREELFAMDHRTGIGIEPDRLATEEAMIYGVSFLSLKEGTNLYAEVVLPDEHADALDGIDMLALGGEGRRVRIEQQVPVFDWPRPTAEGKPLLLLTTPALFSGRWRPAGLNSNLVAAAVPGALAVSGWDLARRGPKPTRFAVPAGSVFFLDRIPDNLSPASLSDIDQRDGDEPLQGWGCYLKGAWNYA
jgi:CRISPR-associated protein Cmr3